jgi:hypothetical protein
MSATVSDKKCPWGEEEERERERERECTEQIVYQ